MCFPLIWDSCCLIKRELELLLQTVNEFDGFFGTFSRIVGLLYGRPHFEHSCANQRSAYAKDFSWLLKPICSPYFCQT